MQDLVLLLVRHALTAGGGWLVSEGLIDADQVQALTGGGLALAGVALSVIDKRWRVAK